jgi:hypothetical protein
MVGKTVRSAVEQHIVSYASSRLSSLLSPTGTFAIKFVASKWADTYVSSAPLKISETPALTWGTATYVTPIAFPLSSALYGRVGLVMEFEPSAWRIFDATTTAAQMAYVRWARAQPCYTDLLLTVHSTQANHLLRNAFRTAFRIDCVLFHPDQEAEAHTDLVHHVWMAVTDWTPSLTIESRYSRRLSNARFSVLLDEEFELLDQGLPIRRSGRKIERATATMLASPLCSGIGIRTARSHPGVASMIVDAYQNSTYLHVYIEP